MKKTILFLFTFSCSIAQDKQAIITAFESAAREFNVPADVLKGIAFAETRWEQLTWAEGDTASACTGMPRPYGIMSLWDNQYFGHSLRQAAALIDLDPSVLKSDFQQNIRGAAALLKKYHDELPLPAGTNSQDIESWRNAIAAYSGLPQAGLAQQHALNIYSEMSTGYHKYHIDWNGRPVNLQPMREAVSRIQTEARSESANNQESPESITNQPDYPLAKWASAYPGHWYTSGNTRSFVVIHDMEGYYLSTISYFQMSSTGASAHYCVNSGYQPDGRPGGEITQMVEEKYWAWHVVCWNSYMFGIEHEGFVNNAAWYTDDMYRSSAQLTAYLCKKYNIPMDRNHIIAHGEWQNPSWTSWMNTNFPAIDVTCNTHTDPGPNWNWNYYMSLVKGVFVATASPARNATNVPAYRNIVIHFSTQMDTASVANALSLTPTIAGTFVWSDNYSTLTFRPNPFFAFSTTYALTIDSTAKDALVGRYLDGTGSGLGPSRFQMSFTTVPLDTSPPVITSWYPHSTTTDFPYTGEVVIRYNEPLSPAQAQSAVQVKDSVGAIVAPVDLKVDSIADKGVISLSSTQFKPNSKYSLEISKGIIDLYGNSTTSAANFNFFTGPESVTEGIVFDSFESNARSWIQPNQNAGSVFIDSNATQFSFSADEVRSGSQSGKLVYSFTQSQNGVAVLQAGASPTLDKYSSFGIWVFGDESRNVFELVFQPQDQSARSDTIDWMGWKFLNISLANLSGTGKKLNAIVVHQTGSGDNSGTLYFENMQVNSVVSDATKNLAAYPDRFALSQNYPNPFNPTTIIRYQLPNESYVRLSVYNLVGQRVRVLVDEKKNSGYYSIPFDGTGLPSGVYFYRLEAGRFHISQKMLLIR
ncbi:MAG TPA: Ig-like domain-containing protein [Bacteroidota bacterium]